MPSLHKETDFCGSHADADRPRMRSERGVRADAARCFLIFIPKRWGELYG